MTDLLRNVLERLTDVRRSGAKYSARCPAHRDTHASLGISMGDGGQVLVKCYAGCTFEAIVSALGLTPADFFPADARHLLPRSGSNNDSRRLWPTPQAFAEFLARKERGRPAGSWTYRHADGSTAFVVVRVDQPRGKTCPPLHPIAGGWHVGDPAGLLPLYRLPETLAAVAERRALWIAEGEKCVDEFVRLGFAATTSAHGALSASKSDWTPLAGADLILTPDHNSAGERYVGDVARITRALDPPARVRLVRLPNLPDGGDIVDYVASRRCAGVDDDEIGAELQRLADAASLEVPAAVAPAVETPCWETPEPLGQFDLPAFPLELIQGELCPFCPLWPISAALAEAYQVPVELAAMLALAVAGAALARRCEVLVTADWWEPLNLFVVIAMEPGERKSAVFRETTAPLGSFERNECERLAADIERNRSDLRMLAAAIKHAEQQAAKATDAIKRQEARQRAHELAEQLRQTPVLAAPRLLADDATPEALAKLLHEQDGRIALLSPEGGVFEQMAGRYSDGMPNLDVYLKGHAGDDIRIDRVSRPPEFVRRPALTVGLAVQPDVLRGLADKPGLRGRGVLARFLYSLPTSKVGNRRLHPDEVSWAVKAAYTRAIHCALELEPGSDESGAPAPHVIRPDGDALAVLDEFRADVERSMREGGALIGLRDWALKLPGAVVRIAGVLHGLEHASSGRPGDVPLSGPTMAAAIAIGGYLIEHAQAAFFEMGANPSIGLARRLLDWVRERSLRTFTRREAYRRLRGLIRSVDGVDGPLELLVQHGYIRQALVEHKGVGRTPSRNYEINPATFGHNGHNGQNSVADGNFGHSVHSVQGMDAQDCDSGESEDGNDSGPSIGQETPLTDPSSEQSSELDPEFARELSLANKLLNGMLPGITPTDIGAYP